MAAIGAALMEKVNGHSEAEMAFRPWWDRLEDYLIYGLVMIGIVLVPTAQWESALVVRGQIFEH